MGTAVDGLVQWLVAWAYTPYGDLALFINAFVESSFFPVPPDVLLIALAVFRPHAALWFAAVCSIGSVLGGAFGYLLGLKGGRPLLRRVVSEQKIQLVDHYYRKYGIWAVGIAGFTPLPYKVFTISAGMFRLDLKGFVVISLISRAARFFLVAGFIYCFGETVTYYVKNYFGVFSLAVAIVGIAGFLALRHFARRMTRVDDFTNEKEG